YKTAIILSADTTIKAKAFKTGYQPSSVKAGKYFIQRKTPTAISSCGQVKNAAGDDTLGGSDPDYSWFHGQSRFAKHYSYTAANNGNLVISLASEVFDTLLYVTNTTTTSWASNDDDR